MTYDPNNPYGSNPQYPQHPQHPPGSQPPQQPQPPQAPQYPPTVPYQTGGNDPTAPIVPSYGGGDPYSGGGQQPYGGGYGQQPQSGGYGQQPQSGGGGYGGDPYGGSPYSGAPYSGGGYTGAPYGQDPYGAAPSSGWPAPPGSVPPGSVPPYGPPPRKRRTGLTIGLVAGGVALVLCLGGAAVVSTRMLADEEPTTDPTAQANPGATDPSNPDNSGDPFADTPAASFAQGADGIQLPEAEAAGDFSAGEVEETLTLVRDALVATRMDESMLLDRDPEPFIGTMSPDSQEALRREFSEGTFGYFASQVDGSAQLAVPEPRVQGTITFEATTDTDGFRVIEVVTNFVWAYAFVPPNDDPELDGVVVVRDRLVWQIAHADDVADTSLGLWLWEGEAYASGIDCAAFDQGLLAPQTEVSFGGIGEDVDENDVYDPEGSLDLPDNC